MKINVEKLLESINNANDYEFNMQIKRATWRRRVGPWLTLWGDSPRDGEEKALIWYMNKAASCWETVNALSDVLGLDVVQRAQKAARALSRWGESNGWEKIFPYDEMKRLGRWILGE